MSIFATKVHLVNCCVPSEFFLNNVMMNCLPPVDEHSNRDLETQGPKILIKPLKYINMGTHKYV